MSDPTVPEAVLVADDLHKSFHQGSEAIEVLNGASFSIAARERVAILGRSGSGKSTLLHILAGLDDTDSGEVRIGGESLTRANAEERAALRNRFMGFIYQAHHLLPEFSAAENVSMPLRLAGLGTAQAMQAAAAVLDRVGLSHRLSHRPATLSGGERQRVAVARALVAKPALVLADEPTGNLDQDNAQQVFALLRELSDEFGSAVVVVTHDQSMLTHVHRALALEQGRLSPVDL
ncbi:MAG: ABC transporter ATP-binding protein [Pseudomonadales bacterium]